LAEGSRNLFAFEWENPETGRKQQFRWTVLPQGFTESPNLFSQVLEKILETFSTPEGTILLQYVDDLLITTKGKAENNMTNKQLLNFLGKQGVRGDLPTPGTKDMFLKKYILGLSSSLSSLRERGLLSQTSPLEFPIHQIRSGEWVLIKTWKETKLQPSWEGPFQVLLTTETAIRTAEKGWTHHTRMKGPVKAPTEKTEWKVETTEDTLKLKLKRL